MRRCSNCHQFGHYSKTCKQKKQEQLSAPMEEPKGKETLLEQGRRILAEENKIVERTPDELGNIPRKGLWLINPERKRVAGKISQVKKDGIILWQDCWGVFVESDPKTIQAGGYKYLELEASHLLFEITGAGKGISK